MSINQGFINDLFQTWSNSWISTISWISWRSIPINVFLSYVQFCSCTRRSKTKILTRAPSSWIEFDVVTSQRQTQIASDCVMLFESITWRLPNHFAGFYKRSINAGTWKSTITNRIQDDKSYSHLTLFFQRQTQAKMVRHSRQYFGFRSSRAAVALHVSMKNITFCCNQG